MAYRLSVESWKKKGKEKEKYITQLWRAENTFNYRWHNQTVSLALCNRQYNGKAYSTIYKFFIYKSTWNDQSESRVYGLTVLRDISHDYRFSRRLDLHDIKQYRILLSYGAKRNHTTPSSDRVVLLYLHLSRIYDSNKKRILRSSFLAICLSVGKEVSV